MRPRKKLEFAAASIRAIALVGFLVAAFGVANGQVSPVGAHHPTVGPGAGVSSPLSPTGGYSAAVPLDLPSPRGGLPVPLAIVYNGSTRAGAAGAGWDVPIWYVQRSNSAFKRKPAAVGDGAVGAAERIYVSLGGAPQLMVPHGSVYVPFMGSEYSELRQSGDGWVLRTLGNVEYTFSTTASVGFYSNDDFWVLTQIRDLSGTDRVTLTYDVDVVCSGKRELTLGHIAYAHNASGTPLYEIKLDYRRWEAETCAGIDNVSTEDMGFTRLRVLESIAVNARNNLDPNESSPLKRIRLYDLIYGVEQDTYKPLLLQVWVFGEEGALTQAQPVSNFGYGSVSRPPETSGGSRIVTFGPWETVPRPGSVTSSNDYKNDIATSDVYRYAVTGREPATPLEPDYSWVTAVVETTRARHLLRDFTGDGAPDLLVYRGESAGWALYPSRLATNGVGFADGSEVTWNGTEGPAEVHVQSTFRFTEATANGAGAPLALGDDPGRFAREALITTETWNQFVDWNGDGRLDVVDVKGGQNSDHWKVWLNEPAPNAVLTWRAIQVDISPVRNALAARGLYRDDYSAYLSEFQALDWSDRLPLERTRSWPRSESWECRRQTCGFNGCSDAGPCDTPDYNTVIGTDSITEWQLTDVNQDGFVDFAANEKPAKHCEKVEVEGNAPNCSGNPYDANIDHWCARKTREWMMRTDQEQCDSTLHPQGDAEYFINRLGPFTGLAESPFSAQPRGLGEVVAHWTTGNRTTLLDWDMNFLDSGLSWQASVPADRFDHGRLGSNTSEYFSSAVATAFESDQHLACADSTNNTFISRQVLGEADLNGDGLADRLDLTGTPAVQFNTGAGYGPPRALKWPTDTFAISESGGQCGDDAHTRAGLTDLDGDGKPELIRAKGGVLYMSRLLPNDGADNLHSAGKLMQIGNLRGGLLRIIYGNAKRELNTEHAVPFPEIVVRQTYAWTADGSAPTSAPTHYAYGGARLEYDPIAGRWVFPGYRRTTSITCQRSPETAGFWTGRGSGPGRIASRTLCS